MSIYRKYIIYTYHSINIYIYIYRVISRVGMEKGKKWEVWSIECLWYLTYSVEIYSYAVTHKIIPIITPIECRWYCFGVYITGLYTYIYVYIYVLSVAIEVNCPSRLWTFQLYLVYCRQCQWDLFQIIIISFECYSRRSRNLFKSYWLIIISKYWNQFFRSTTIIFTYLPSLYH